MDDDAVCCKQLDASPHCIDSSSFLPLNKCNRFITEQFELPMKINWRRQQLCSYKENNWPVLGACYSSSTSDVLLSFVLSALRAPRFIVNVKARERQERAWRPR